jgi:hypothetical protein
MFYNVKGEGSHEQCFEEVISVVDLQMKILYKCMNYLYIRL